MCYRQSYLCDKLRKTCPDVPQQARAKGLNLLQPAPRKEGKPRRKRDRQRLGCANGDIEDSLTHKHFCWINAIAHSHARWINTPTFCQRVNKILKSHNCLFSGDAASWSHLSGSRRCHHHTSSPETWSVTCPRAVNAPRVYGHFRILLGTRFGG